MGTGRHTPKYIIIWLRRPMFSMYQHANRKCPSPGERHQPLLIACTLCTYLFLLLFSGTRPFQRATFFFFIFIFKKNFLGNVAHLKNLFKFPKYATFPFLFLFLTFWNMIIPILIQRE